MQLNVVKRSGVIEPFDRAKVIAGVKAACKGRPVSDADLTRLGQQVEEAVRATGSCDVQSDEVGVAILGPLRDLDTVAYLRFASVYKHWQDPNDFCTEIENMRQQGKVLQ